METLSVGEARRLALARTGLLRPEWTGFPWRAGAGADGSRAAAVEVVRRLGYLQLDPIAIAGARSHAIVLHSRLRGLDAAVPETLLAPGAPLFEYWGHEASWLGLELYPLFAFRRRAFRHHPWWGPVIDRHRGEARALLLRVRDEGPLRSADLESGPREETWSRGPMQRLAHALWSSGALAIRERRGFQRVYDLPERVIPERWRAERVPRRQAFERLALRALEGLGWATTTTVADTWRPGRQRAELEAALRRLAARGCVRPCALVDGRSSARGWIREQDLALAERLRRARPRGDVGVMLSPFDNLLWDRARVKTLFGFDLRLEIYKPAARRLYGYYCLPVLAGERLVARYDLRAERGAGRLRVLSLRFEAEPVRPPAADRAAARSALARFAAALRLRPEMG